MSDGTNSPVNRTIDLRIRPEPLFAAILVVGAAILLVAHHHIYFWGDDWSFVLDRKGFGVHQLFDEYNGHFVVLPLLAYKLFDSIFGVGTMWPYYVLETALSVAVAAMVFEYVRRCVDPWPAVMAGTLTLLMGSGWENLLWTFEIGFLGSIAAGLGALLMLDPPDTAQRRRWASILLVISICCSGMGIIFMIGIALRCIWRSERRRTAFVLAAPVAVFIVWWAAFGHAYHHHPDFGAASQFAQDLISYAFAGILGAQLPWGTAMAVAAGIGLFVIIGRRNRISPAQATTLALPLAFWSLTALERAGFAEPWPTRYAYVGIVFILIAAAELARGARVNSAHRWMLGALLAVSLVSNLNGIKVGAAFLRDNTANTRAELTALHIAAPNVAVNPPTFDPSDPSLTQDHVPKLLATLVDNWQRLTYQRDDSVDASPARRAQVDRTLIQLEHPVVTPAVRFATSGGPPVKVLSSGPTRVTPLGGCVRVAPGKGAHVDVALPRAGVNVQSKTVLSLSLRRFSGQFFGAGLPTVGPGVVNVTPPRDNSPAPWTARLSGASGFIVCGR